MENSLIGAGTITASSYQSTYPPGNAFDGNTETFWASDWRAGESPVNNAQLYYHFIRPVWLKKLRIFANRCRTITLSYSIDGVSYTNINTYDVGTKVWNEYVLNNPIQLVHLKFDCHADTGGQVTICEIQAYGQ